MFYTDAKPRAPLAEYDQGLVWAALLLLGLGLVMVYSSSIAIAEGSRATGYQPTYYLMRHGLFVAVSMAAAVAVFQVPLRLWQQAAPFLFLCGAGVAGPGADPRHRARGERQPALDLAAFRQRCSRPN